MNKKQLIKFIAICLTCLVLVTLIVLTIKYLLN